MSQAVNTENPRYSKLTIGVCPDQWGVWFPEDPKQMDPRQAWQEMAEAGFSVIETGPFGYFPTDPKELQKWCDEYGMRVVAGTGWGILHKQEAWADTIKTFRAIAETHAAVGAEYIVHLPPLYRDDKTWEWTDDRVLSDDAWKLYVDHANALGQMLLDEYGLKMVLHPERITYVHIKAFDEDITREAHEKDWPFGEAVTKGASVCPPKGLPEMHAFVDALADLNKDIYCICEQDCYPCEPSFPKQNAINMRKYLAECGLGLA